jgi:hypothetical protein
VLGAGTQALDQPASSSPRHRGKERDKEREDGGNTASGGAAACGEGGAGGKGIRGADAEEARSRCNSCNKYILLLHALLLLALYLH